eukprot:m.255320 g.255320  ORF g.255320 m.255320 type:complete len:362 (+) comp19363_c0_seq1:63-1148(+)
MTTTTAVRSSCSSSPRRTTAVLAAAVCVFAVLVAAATTRWTVRIVLSPDRPPTFQFPSGTQDVAAGIVGASTPQDDGLAADGRQSLEQQLRMLGGDSTDFDVSFQQFEETMQDGFVLVIDVVTNGTDPTSNFMNLQNLTIMFREETQTYTFNNTMMGNMTTNGTNPTGPRIRVEPRTEDGSDVNVPLIIGVIFGVLGSILLVVVVVLVVKRYQQQQQLAKEAGVSLRPVSRPGDEKPIRQQEQDIEMPRPIQIRTETTPVQETPVVQVNEPAKMSDVKIEQVDGTDEPATIPGQLPDPTPEEQPHAAEENMTGETLESEDIAHLRASYRWNATANAVADPTPGGRVVGNDFSDVVESATQH